MSLDTSTSTASDRPQLIRVGDLAKLTGKTVRAIHLYEEVGLLQPTTRTSGGFRLYPSSAVDRVRWIDLLHTAGFSLHEMRGVLKDWWSSDLGPEAMQRLRQLFTQKLAETRASLERHQRVERELLDGLAYLQTCRVCATPEAVVGCVRCEQDHGMSNEPALLAGITQRPERSVTPRSRSSNFVPLVDIERRPREHKEQ